MTDDKCRGGLTMGKKYCYNKSQYDFAQVIIDDIREEKEPSMDEWDRGYNSGLTAAIRIIKKYRENYEANYRVIKEG